MNKMVIRRVLPNATTVEITWDGQLRQDKSAVEDILDTLDTVEKEVRERMDRVT